MSSTAANNLRRPAPARGFTLVELLVVIAIIITLVGLTLGAIGCIQKAKRVTQAQKEIVDIVAACETYKAFFHTYPPDTGNYGTGEVPEMVTDPAAIYRYLGHKVTDPLTSQTCGPLLTIKPERLVGEVYCDPWKRPYHMDNAHPQADAGGNVTIRGEPYPPGTPGEVKRAEVKVWSDGPDKKFAKGSNMTGNKGSGDDFDNNVSWRQGVHP